MRAARSRCVRRPARAPRPRRACALRGSAEPRRSSRFADDGERVASWAWSELMAAWSETSHAMQRLRDNPASADAELDWRCDDRRSRHQPRLSFASDEDICAPYIVSRRASARRDPARPGCQRSDRNGRGVHARRLRCGRRAHERPAERSSSTRPISGFRRLRRFQLRRRARCRARLGGVDSVQRRVARAVRRIFRRSARISRSASAMAAR